MSAITGFPGFKFGCDPEFFIVNEEGVPVSAAGLIPGTKFDPYPVEYGAVQVDGMAAEFNIDPVDNYQDWNRNIRAVMAQLQEMLPSGYGFSQSPAIRFDPAVFDNAPDEAKILGCTPDFDAWTGEVNPPPCDPEDPYLRTASGHIHIGWTEDADFDDEEHLNNCRDLVKQLDWHLGGWSIRVDKDPTRRKMYGKAGAMRYKSYGVEYRVLSNFWIFSSDRRKVIWNRLQQAIQDMRLSHLPTLVGIGNNDLLVKSINETTEQPGLKPFQYPLRSSDTGLRII